MTWADLLQYIYDSPVGTTVRQSDTLFPWIESIHVLMITTVLGTIAIVDLRLLGYRSHRRGLRRLTLDMLPITWIAFALAVMTGLLLFTSNATGYWGNTAFRFKMVLLLLAGLNMGVFHLTAYKTVGQWDDDKRPPLAARVAGGMSLVLWISVVFFGRWIGFTLNQ